MELEVLKKEKNLLEFIIKGERHTLPNLLKTNLLENKEIEFVAYKLDHPMDADSIFVLKTKKENPKKVLLGALKEITKELDVFSSAVKKAFK